jgi:hypothetical protein
MIVFATISSNRSTFRKYIENDSKAIKDKLSEEEKLRKEKEDKMSEKLKEQEGITDESNLFGNFFINAFLIRLNVSVVKLYFDPESPPLSGMRPRERNHPVVPDDVKRERQKRG